MDFFTLTISQLNISFLVQIEKEEIYFDFNYSILNDRTVLLDKQNVLKETNKEKYVKKIKVKFLKLLEMFVN